MFNAAERLFALHGFQNVSVRDITADAGVNLASVNYHFGSKDALLFEIFRRRAGRAEPRTGAHAARGQRPARRQAAGAGHPGGPVRPAAELGDPANDRRISVQFLIRARSEGTAQMRDALQNDVVAPGALRRRPDRRPARDLAPETVYWRLHFALGMVHNNRFAEFDRLQSPVRRPDREDDVPALLKQMLDFAEAGFRA